MNGLVLIDKPSGLTSHDVVNRWRRMAATKRVGHLGTLDPMATGLLVLVSGLATRLAPFFTTDEKSYEGEITFGLTSDTFDVEGELQSTGQAIPNANQIAECLRGFEGSFLQTPPRVSAKKINGVAAYKLARQKVDFDLKPVQVEVRDLEWAPLTDNRIRVTLTCSAGTYVRSIAHDLGQRLGCGAVLSALRRTAVAGIPISRARTLDQISELAAAGRLSEVLIPMGQLLPQLPAEYVTEDVERQIRQGRDFRTSPFVIEPGTPVVRALSRSGELVAIGEIRFPNSYHPATVF
jgi:tRNA pseudouridine55 synthase